jgi:PPOX class probable F420-dependent enzyme
MPDAPSSPCPWSAAELAFLAGARRATLATTAPDGRPRLVPVCFALLDDREAPGRPVLYTPIDEKPKRGADPLGLARVRDLVARPAVTLLADRWDEDWQRLGWVRVDGRARILAPAEEPEHARAREALRARYPQYLHQALDARPIIRIAIERLVSWGALDV